MTKEALLNEHIPVVTDFGEMADDILYSILLIKQKDVLNKFLPFMHAHVLELSAKAFCRKHNLQNDIRDGHDLMKIYKKIELVMPELHEYLPDESAFENYHHV